MQIHITIDTNDKSPITQRVLAALGHQTTQVDNAERIPYDPTTPRTIDAVYSTAGNLIAGAASDKYAEAAKDTAYVAEQVQLADPDVIGHIAPAPPAEVATIFEISPAPTVEAATAALRSLIDRKGVPAAVQLLEELGVKRVTELNDVQRAEFIATAGAL